MTEARKARTPSHRWTEAEIVDLTRLHGEGGKAAVLEYFSELAPAIVESKLIQHKLEAKPEKPVLDQEAAFTIERFASTLAGIPEPQRTLAIRYAAKLVDAVREKRPRKVAE